MILKVPAPLNDLGLRLNKCIIHIVFCNDFLNGREIIRMIAARDDIVPVYQFSVILCFHKKAHRFFLNIAANDFIIWMLFPDDPGDGARRQSADTGDENSDSGNKDSGSGDKTKE